MERFGFLYEIEMKRNDSKSLIVWNISIVEIEVNDYGLFLLHTGDIIILSMINTSVKECERKL
jgi:hypothetical protein